MTLNGVETPVRAGQAVFIPGMAEHGIRQTGTDACASSTVSRSNSFDTVEYLFSDAKAAGSGTARSETVRARGRAPEGHNRHRRPCHRRPAA